MMDLQEGNRESAFGTLRKNVDQVAGHFAEVTARRLLGQALIEHGSEDRDRETSLVDETWEPVMGEYRSIRNHCRELRVTLEQPDQKGRSMNSVRVYPVWGDP